jgi:hypothetical protein
LLDQQQSKEMKMKQALVAIAILGSLFVAVDHANADTPRGPKTPCAMEGDNDCVWDAVHMGNGIGHSYIATKSGRVIYISHARAHRLAFGS